MGISFKGAEVYGQSTTINYTYSSEDFVNPERGFYRYSETRSANYSLLDSATIAGYRNLTMPFSANFSVYTSLVFRYFFLEDFKNSTISASYLENIQKDFDTARKAGVKLIPRFAYTDEVDGSTCGSFICPPYGDAPKNIVLQHIAQLKPVLQANADVLFSVQMGLIGTWGENYYTDYFGDASQAPFQLTSQNWSDRIEVLDSLLGAVPNSRSVQVRYPQMKQKAVYGSTAPTSSVPITLAEAYQGTNKSRIGFHNDCYLASPDDFGTYLDYDTGLSDTTIFKPYNAAETKFVPMGGETCFNYAGGLCEAEGGIAIEDMSRMHFTYLNADFNNELNNQWVGSCLNDVKLGLGYRIKLNSATFDNTASAGQAFNFSINIENVGFAGPVNGRDVEIIFRNTTTQETWEVSLDEDPRLWLSGAVNVTGQLCLSECMAVGQYEILLNLPDPEISIHNNPLYSIRLANMNTWESTTGYNKLNHTVTVSEANANCTASLSLERTEGSNDWIGPTNQNWYAAASNWSHDRFPDECDEVFIPEGIEINLLEGESATAKRITLGTGAQILLADGSNLSIK